MATLPDNATLQKQQDEALSMVQQMLADSNSAVGAYSSQLKEAGVDVAKLAETQKGAITSMANSEVIIQSQAQNAELWAQNTADAIYEASGGEIAQVAQMQRYKDLSTQMQDLQDTKRNMMSEQPTGIWIFDQIANSINSLDVDKEINLLATQLDTTTKLAAGSAQMQEGYAKVNSLNKQMVTNETIASNNDKIMAAATQEKAKVDYQKIQFNSDNLRAQMQAQNSLVQNTLSGVDVSMKMEDQKARRVQQDLEAQRITMQQEEFVIRREQMQMQRDEWAVKKDLLPLQYEATKLELQDKLDMAPTERRVKMAQLAKLEEDIVKQKSYESEIVKSVSAAQMVLDIPMETPEVILEKFQNPTTRARYIKYQEMGMDTGKVTFGNTPYAAASSLAEIDPYGKLADTTAVKVLSGISDAVLASMQADPTTAPKNKDQQEAYFNTVAKGYMLSKAQKIVAGDSTNPYQAAPFNVLASESPKIASSPLYQKVLKPYALKETNPQRIADLAASGVKAGLIKPEEAAQGMVDIFTSAAIYNNTFQGGFERAGLGFAEQKSYLTQVKVKPTFTDLLTNKLGSPNVVNPMLRATWDYVGKDETGNIGPKALNNTVNLMSYSDSLLLITKLLSSGVGELPSTTPKDANKDTTKE